MLKRFACILTIVFLFSFLAESLHFHVDGDDDGDCAICFASHHQSDADFTVSLHVTETLLTQTAYIHPVLAAVSKTFCSAVDDRAPPA